MSAICAATFLMGMPELRADGLDDAYLTEVRDGFEERQANALQQQMFTPFPSYSEVAASSIYAWNRLNFALAALFRHKDNPEANQNFINAANKAIIDVCAQYLQAGPNVITGNSGSEGGMHWIGNHLVRLHEYFCSDSPFYPGLLSEKAESDLRELLWMWVSNAATLEDADATRNNTWVIRESENHSAMKDQLSWGGAKILRRFEPYKSMQYNDGSTAEEQYEAWDDFLIQYLRERGKRGLLVEYHSNSYTKYTMQNFYNYFDLSETPILREMARSVLDLMWADAAHGTLGDVVGGAATRNARPEDVIPLRNGFSALMWYYYGKGQALNRHPGNMMLMTSEYRIPLVVMDIALDREGRGTFEYFSRRPGINVEGKENSFAENRSYYVDAEDSQILRYSYVTPDFVLGTHIIPKLPHARWSGIHRSNRWHGVLIRGNVNALIVPQVTATTWNNRTQNEQWAIQRKGTLITQKLTTSSASAEMRVYFPGENVLFRMETQGWVFAGNDNAFVAVRPVLGGYEWDDSNWMRLLDEYSPVIVEVARSQDYADFESFQTAVLETSIEVVGENGNRRLEYTGLGDSGEFVFSMDTDEMPTIDGEPYDLAPDYTYKSPFLNADWPGSKVYIEKGLRSMTLDFDLQLPSPSEMNPQWRASVYVDRKWYNLDGFGWFSPLNDDWLFHYELGWLYSPSAPGNSVWLFLESSGEWIWTSTEFNGYLTPFGQEYTPNNQ